MFFSIFDSVRVVVFKFEYFGLWFIKVGGFGFWGEGRLFY